MAQNAELGSLIKAAIHENMECDCGASHQINQSCPSLNCQHGTSEDVEARVEGVRAQTILQYIKDNPTSIS